jgi:hypothetical protein
MMIVVTGPRGDLMYFNEETPTRGHHAFGMQGSFRGSEALAFTTVSGYAANANYAPEGMGGAITHDLGIDFLFRIAGAR